MRQLLTGSGHSSQGKKGARDLFTSLAQDGVAPDLESHRTAFDGAVSKVELGDGGQEAVRLALIRVVIWLKTSDQEQYQSAILATTTTATRKHDRMTVMRCYAESESAIPRYFRQRALRMVTRSDPPLTRSCT